MADSLSILFVEDEDVLRELVADALRDAGHAIQDASSGAEALGYLEGDAPFDVLLTDMGMPGMSGMELAEAALGLRPRMTVVIASGFAKAQLPEFPQDFFYVPKPYRVTQLESFLRELAEGQGSTAQGD